MNRYLSVKELRVHQLLWTPQIDHVFLDVFDTLIQRTIEPPDLTKIPACHALRELEGFHSPGAPTQALLGSRLEAERKEREARRSAGFDPECQIRQVFERWSRAWLRRSASNEQLGKLENVELEGEKAVCRPVDGMPALVERLQADGKHILVVSDMYLDARQLQQLLSHTGYSIGLEQIYVSSAVGFAKYSGRLFDHILKRENIAPERVVHIGDTPGADAEPARKLKMHCLLVDEAERRSRHRIQKVLKHLEATNKYWAGLGWQKNVAFSHRWSKERLQDPLYRVGHDYVGPLIVNFVHRLMQHCMEDRVDLLIFPAREGFVLEEVYRKLRKRHSGEPVPASTYAFVTRKSTYLPSLKRIGERELFLGFHTPTKTLRSMLIRFSLDPEEMQGAAEECGFSGLDELIRYPREDNRLRLFFEHEFFRQRLRERQQESAELLYRYLEQLGVWRAERPAIVDVGWLGTVQESIAEAFCDRQGWRGLKGYYLALNADPGKPYREDAPAKGILHDLRTSISHNPLGRFAELLEMATRAPHGTTLGYRHIGERVVPVLRGDEDPVRQAEIEDQGYVTSLQAGIFDYADAYADLLPFRLNEPRDDSEFLMSRLDRLIRIPRSSEAKILRNFCHSEDVGQGLVSLSRKAAKRKRQSRKNQGALASKHRLIWAEGFWTTRGLPTLGLIYNLFRVIARRRY